MAATGVQVLMRGEETVVDVNPQHPARMRYARLTRSWVGKIHLLANRDRRIWIPAWLPWISFADPDTQFARDGENYLISIDPAQRYDEVPATADTQSHAALKSFAILQRSRSS